MTKPIIYIFSGPPGVGKDTIASLLWTYLEERQHKSVSIEKFAEPIYEAISAFHMTMPLDLAERKERNVTIAGKTYHHTYRADMIDFSTWAKARYGDDIFGRILLDGIDNTDDFILITDGRFIEEVQPLLDADYTVRQIKLSRKDAPPVPDSWTDWHHSEVETTIVFNHAEVEDAVRTVLKIMRALGDLPE